MKRLLLLATLLSTPAMARAQDDVAKVYDNMARDAAVCVSFFALASSCVKESGDADMAELLLAAQDRALYAHFEYSRNAGQGRDAMEERIKATGAQMMRDVGGGCRNLPEVLAEHSFYCRAVVKDPSGHFSVWATAVMPALIGSLSPEQREERGVEFLSREQFIERSED